MSWIGSPIYAVVAALIATSISAAPVAARDCKSDNRSDRICSDRELLALEVEVDARANRIAAISEPLTAVLLRRDQRWFSATLENPTDDDPVSLRQQTTDLLQRRMTMLGRLQTGPVDSPAGQWANAHGTAKVDEQAPDTLAVAIALSVPSESDRRAACALTVEARLRADGWYAGRAVATKIEKDPDQSNDDSDASDDQRPQRSDGKAEAIVRLRLQGNTLRIVSDSNDNDFCIGPDMVTGTFFPLGTAAHASSGLAARTVAPSFNCANAKNLDELEICADPDLAARDADIGRAYASTLQRIDTKLAGHLRNDQRAWVKENATVAETWLNPYWDKRSYFIDHTSSMRAELDTRQRERLAMLTHLDDKRHGLAGRWVAHNALVVIAAAKDKTGAMQAKGQKWETGDHKSHCEFDLSGKIVGDRFRAEGDDDRPALRRDGATLTIDGDDPDPDQNGNVDRMQPDYCSRLRSAKARLFPVSAGANVGDVEHFRIR
jgi:uncharacterized protein